MAQCGTCRRVVDGNAPYCPGCGRQNPGAGQADAVMIAGGIIIAVVLALFLAPALLVILPFKDSFGDAFYTALGSVWAWLGSAAFWAVMGYLVYTNWKPKPATGRTFNCYQCGKPLQEMTYGLLDNGGAICPFCQGHNVLKVE